jgi:hypothetical protein
MEKHENKTKINGGWNYRIVYHPASTIKIGDSVFDRDSYVAIHEVFYNKNGEPYLMTESEILTGDYGEYSIQSLQNIIEMMKKAFEKPVLDYRISSETFTEIHKEKYNEFSKSNESKK